MSWWHKSHIFRTEYSWLFKQQSLKSTKHAAVWVEVARFQAQLCEARFSCEARSGRKEESVEENVRQPGDLDSGRGRSEPLLAATAFHEEEEEEEEEFHEEEGSGRGSSWHHVRDAPRKALFYSSQRLIRTHPAARLLGSSSKSTFLIIVIIFIQIKKSSAILYFVVSSIHPSFFIQCQCQY